MDFRQDAIPALIHKIALPVSLGILFSVLLSITDTLYVGMLSPTALAALSVAALVFFLVLTLGIGVGQATKALVGNELGADRSARSCSVLLLILCASLSGCASLVRPNYSQELSELRPGDYTLDPEHAYVNFKVGHLGLSKIVGRFNVVAGSLDFNPESITDLRLQGLLEADSIDVNNDRLESTLQEAAWFNVSTYPQIAFTTTSVTQAEDGLLNISGDLALRGVTRPIVLITRFNGGADNILTGKYTLGFTATTTIKRSDFGMDAFAALVADDIEIEMHGEFQRNQN